MHIVTIRYFIAFCLLFSTIASAAEVISNDRVFSYGEANYPNFFPATSASTNQQFEQYTYRIYLTSGNYLAVDTSGIIYMLGESTQNKITAVGTVSEMADEIIAWEALQKQPVADSAPTHVVISKVDEQSVGTQSIASTTKLHVSWSAPSDATPSTYQIVANETSDVGKVTTTATADATNATLSGLKAATRYAISVTACFDADCTSQAAATAVNATTADEYWQLQGSGNAYTSLTKVVTDGSSLSWVMRWGNDAGTSYNGRYQYYYKSNSATGRGIGIATTTGSDISVNTLSSFVQNTAAGLRNPCNGPDSTTGCPQSAAYFINAIQAVPLKSNKLRVFFEAIDATEAGQPTRIYALDSQDGLVGQDFNSSSTKAYCGGTGSTDFIAGGVCAPSVVLGVATDSGNKKSPLTQARQFKIGWDWLEDWRWDESAGTFMVITGADACNKQTDALFYASWDGSKWTVVTDSAGCATPLVNTAHGPVLVPLGGVRYKMYYEDQSGGTQSGKPLRLIYADGSSSGASATVDIGDWESSSTAREVYFLWPDGTVLDAQDEAGLGDHMILTPANTLDQQFMFVNLGGFDNTKWRAPSSGLGLAKLLNP